MNDDMPSHHGVKTTLDGEYPNETIRLLHCRASCRAFTPDPIPEDVLRILFEAAIHSATGGNLQPYSIIRIEREAARIKMAEVCGQRFMARAPLHLIFCVDWARLERWAGLSGAPFTAPHSFRHFWVAVQDTTIAAQNLCTAADAMGLGSVYIGTILDLIQEARDLFDLPPGVLPAILLCLGYPKRKPLSRKKLGPEIVVHRETYQPLSDEALEAAFDNKYTGHKVAITEERLEKIAAVCRRVHGATFAEACLARIHAQGFLNPAQHLFGLHYTADEMPQGNEDFLRVLKECGFDCFEDFKPPMEP